MSTREDFDHMWATSRFRFLQPTAHGPVYLDNQSGAVQAWCVSDDWVGPDRSGDVHAVDLALDDAVQHSHRSGFRCGVCEPCVSGLSCWQCGRPVGSITWGAWQAGYGRGTLCAACDETSEPG